MVVCFVRQDNLGGTGNCVTARRGTILTQPSVLIVEDDAALRRILGLTLREAGFEPTDTATGREALDALTHLSPDAVVLDLGLPEGEGKVVLENLTRLREMTGHAPSLIVMSALSREDAVQRYGPLRVPFMSKPFDPWDLTRLLIKLLAARH